MKKVFIIYILCIFAGLGLIITAFTMGFKWDDAVTFFTDEKNYIKADTILVNEEIKTLLIDLDTRDVTITKNQTDTMTIDYYQYKDTINIAHTQQQVNIIQKEKFTWFNYKIPSFDKKEIIISIPATWQFKLDAKAHTGNITLDGLNINELDLYSSTGNIKLNNISGNQATIKNHTGSMRVDQSQIAKLTLNTTTGNIYVSGAYQAYSLDLKTLTGNIYVDKVKKSKDYQEQKGSNKMIAHTQTGNVSLSFN